MRLAPHAGTFLCAVWLGCRHDDGEKPYESDDTPSHDTSDSADYCPEGSTEEEMMYLEVWEVMNERYPYLEYKGIDWSDLGERCRVVFACDGEVTYDRFIDEAMSCLLSPLADGHVGIIDRSGSVHYYGWNFGVANINTETVEAYLDTDAGVQTSHTRTGTLDDGLLGYIRVATWAESALGDVDVGGLIDEVGYTVEGIVVDMRGNLGGSPYTAQRLAGRFTDDTVTPYAYLHLRVERDGDPDSHEFAAKTAETMRLENVLGEQFSGPTAILMGPGCASACETFVSMMTTLVPGVRTFGSNTAGSDSRYSGDVLEDRRTEFYYSTTAVVAADRSTYIEWTGFQPDEPVGYSGGSTDEVLEAAITWLRGRD